MRCQALQEPALRGGECCFASAGALPVALSGQMLIENIDNSCVYAACVRLSSQHGEPRQPAQQTRDNLAQVGVNEGGLRKGPCCPLRTGFLASKTHDSGLVIPCCACSAWAHDAAAVARDRVDCDKRSSQRQCRLRCRGWLGASQALRRHV